MRFVPSAVAFAVAATFSSGIFAAYTDPITVEGAGDPYRITDSDIVIDVATGSDAVFAKNGGKIFLGGDQTDDITINAKTKDDAVSALTNNGTPGTLVNIQANRSVIINSESAGLWTQSGTQNDQTPADSATINITADEIFINAAQSAVIAFSNSRVNLKANRIELKSQSGTALDVRGYSEVNVGNADGTGTVVINGDIGFETPGAHENSGTIIDAYVNVYLNGPDSSWKGNVYALYPKDAEQDGEQNPSLVSSSNLKVTLADGAQWTPRTITPSDDVTDKGVKVHKKYQALNHLNLSGGVINLTEGASQVVEVENLAGTGGTINATAAEENGTLSSSRIVIGTVDQGENSPALAVKYTGITADQITEENDKGLKAVAISDANQSIATTETVDEGDINGQWKRETAADGTSTTTVSANTKLADYSSVNAMALVQWRNEINHLTKRLGDIRASESAIGAWARVYGGASEWGGSDEVDMDHTTIQVGGDYRVSNNWIVGGAFSYTDSDANLVNGNAEGESYSLAAYATWLSEKGSYLDVIARYGYLKNDIYAGNMVLDTSSNAFSLSLEGGHQFRFMEQAYIEPQIELTYGFISGDDATASNGVKIDQDDYQNFITRVGVRTGFDLPEKAGTVYAMLSYSYDFMGDADGTASKGSLRQDISEDLGGGWVTYGIGAQFRLGDQAYAYGELERTSGGDVVNPYLFNVGLRWNF